MAKAKPKPPAAKKPKAAAKAVIKPVKQGKPAKGGISSGVKKKGKLYVKPNAGSPGIQSNQVNPYNTGDEMWEQFDTEQGWTDEVDDLAAEKAQRLADLPQTLEDIQRNAIEGRESANSSATERGIFQSSIRARDIGDIDSAQVIATTAAQNLVANAGAQLESLKTDIQQRRRPKLNAIVNMQAVENAREHNDAQPWGVKPGTGATAGGYDHNPSKPGIQRKPMKPGATKPNGVNPGRGALKPQPNRPGKNKQAGKSRYNPGGKLAKAAKARKAAR